MRRRWLVAPVLVAGALLAWWRFAGDGQSPVPDTGVAPSAAPDAPASAAQADVTRPRFELPFASALQPDPLQERFERSSLRDTVPDGAVALDANGTLRHDADLRRYFDYWLTLQGEFTDDEIWRLMRDATRATHGEAIAQAVFLAFGRYLSMRDELGHATVGTPAERLQRLRDVRRRHFGDEDATRMWGEEEAQIAHTLAQQDLQTDPTLDDATRAARLAALDAQRPPAQRQGERDATAAHLAAEQTRQLDAAGADDGTRRAEREALWGSDAAARLAALDAQRAAWDARLVEFARARDRVLADPRLDDTGRRLAVDALLQRDFSDPERARVDALLRTGTLPPGG